MRGDLDALLALLDDVLAESWADAWTWTANPEPEPDPSGYELGGDEFRYEHDDPTRRRWVRIGGIRRVP